MNKYPEYIEVKDKLYKINTDFRIALECDDIFKNDIIGEYEKMLAMIYKLLGEEALSDYENQGEIIELLIKYMQCDKSQEELANDEEPSMDFKQDFGYIQASFMSDYGIDLNDGEMHWWRFNDLLRGLTENSVLNRVRYVREEPLNGKKGKELEKWAKAKKQVALRHEKTAREKELDKLWEKNMGKE